MRLSILAPQSQVLEILSPFNPLRLFCPLPAIEAPLPPPPPPFFLLRLPPSLVAFPLWGGLACSTVSCIFSALPLCRLPLIPGFVSYDVADDNDNDNDDNDDDDDANSRR